MRHSSDHDFASMRSAMPGVVSPALQQGEVATVTALMRQMERTQWLDAATLAERQFRQLAVLARHFAVHSRPFAARLHHSGLKPEDMDNPIAFRQLSPITRRDIQEAGPALFCAAVPPSHGATFTTRTSGSTGEPVITSRTGVNHYFWLACMMRDHGWHARDQSGALAIIRGHVENADHPHWGKPVNLFYATGPQYARSMKTPPDEQARWLEKISPTYILTASNNLTVLLEEIAARGIRLPRLHHVRTYGETLYDHLRPRCRAVLGVDIVDIYSSEEAGAIALQCPDSDLYHIMAENLIVEVVDDNGQACRAGVIGKVLITDLHNFSTPLIRYDIGDYAEAGPACPCGRGLPTLKKIMGKRRNMMVAKGQKRWPVLGAVHHDLVAPVRQFQYIQKNEDLIEVRLAVDPPLNDAQTDRLAAMIRRALDVDCALRFVCFPDRIPLGPGGKTEDFICEIP